MGSTRLARVLEAARIVLGQQAVPGPLQEQGLQVLARLVVVRARAVAALVRQ